MNVKKITNFSLPPFILKIFILFILFSLTANALELRTFKLKWNKVEGTNGYQIEYKKIKDKTSRKIKTPSNHIILKLPAGKYKLKIAGLNKFGRPGPFSNWKKFTIKNVVKNNQKFTHMEKKDEVINLDQQKKEVKKLTKIFSQKSKRQFSFEWQMFFPGWTHYRRNQAWKSYAYWATFSSLVGFGIYHTIAANTLANNQKNNGDFLIVSLGTSSLAEVLLAQKQLNTRKTNYKEHINWQYNIGYISVAVYALYWLDLFFFTPIRRVDHKVQLPSKKALSFSFELNKFDPLRPNNNIISMRVLKWF